MTASLILLAVILLGSIAIGLYRIVQGPTPTDAMLAALLIGTTGTAIALLLAVVMALPSALDVALTLSMLAAVIGVAFVRCGWQEDGE